MNLKHSYSLDEEHFDGESKTDSKTEYVFGYYWIKINDQWHVAYHNYYGWNIAYQYNGFYRDTDTLLEVASEIGPKIELPK